MPEQTPTLREMIQGALNSGATYRQLAKDAVDEETGKRASYSMFFDIANGKLDRMPPAAHLRAIAAGLRAPYESVRLAAIAQWLPAEGTRRPSMPPAPAGIDPKQWASWDDVGRQQVLDAMKIAERRRTKLHSNEGTPAEC